MRDSLTPRTVSRALHVSESSIKRWCDKGVIPTQYTAGGHRRIPMSGLLEFLRNSKQELVHPDVIGLPSGTGRSSQTVERSTERLVEALMDGNEELCRQITIDLYLAEHSISLICDHIFAAAFEKIGNLWLCGDAEVYQERRSCEIALRVLYGMESLIPPPPKDCPIAIGGAVEGDQYSLATTMAELVLRDAKWNAMSLGDDLPLDTFGAAIKQKRPKLLWMSCSHLRSVPDFLTGYHRLYDEFGLDVAFVVGGRALTDEIRQQMKYAAFCDNMQHLEAFAQTIRVA